MKSFMTLMALLMLPLVAGAQEATLIGNEIDHGGSGGVTAKLTSINGQATMMLGAEAVWTINHSMYAGAVVQGVVTEADANKLQPGGQPYLMWVNELGARAGYILNSDEIVHFSAGALVGAGSLQLADRYFWSDPAKVETYGDQDYYFLVEPEVAAEVNVTPWMRAKAAASYRIVSGVETEGNTSGDLSGPAGAITLSFGSF
jgi:hypothetical protein